MVTTVGQRGRRGKDGTGSTARFYLPWKLAFDEEGQLVVAKSPVWTAFVWWRPLVPLARLAAKETAVQKALRAFQTGSASCSTTQNWRTGCLR